MKKRFLLLVTCIAMAIMIAATASFVVSADTETGAETGTETTVGAESTDAPDTEGEGEDEDALFTLEFLSGDKPPVAMTLNGTAYTCTVELDGGAAYPFVVKNFGSVMDNCRYLFYKQDKGTATFSYSLENKATVAGGDGDVFDAFDFSSEMVYIHLIGAVFTELPGKFEGKSVVAFFFDAGEKVSVSATVEEGMRFKEWKVDDTSITLGDKDAASFILPKKVKSPLNIEAVSEPTLEKLLSESNSITLESDYIVDKTIKLTEGEYTINLGGHKIEAQGTIFDVDGATLKIEGEGEMANVGSTGFCIKVNKGTLEISGGKLSGFYSAIDAGGMDSNTQVSIKGGEFVSGSMAALNFINCEATITGGTFVGGDGVDSALLIRAVDGSVSINGGVFNAANCVFSHNSEKDNIKIYAGDFASDVSDYVVAGSAIKNENGRFVVATDSNLYQLEVSGGKGSGLYKVGETVTITLDKTGKTTEFKGWVVVSGELTLEDAAAESFSFKMPAGDVKLKAEFEEEATTPAETTPATKPVTTPVGNVGNADTTDKADDGEGKKSILPIILIIILVALIVAILAILVILLIRKKNAEIEEQERAQISSEVMDSLADKLAGLGLGAVPTAAAKPQNAQVRPRPVRRRPTANFEPEDLTVTKEMNVDQETKEDDGPVR